MMVYHPSIPESECGSAAQRAIYQAITVFASLRRGNALDCESKAFGG
jgi:hypothetical protein